MTQLFLFMTIDTYLTIFISDIVNLNIPTGIPLVYHLDENMNVIPSDNAIAPLRGEYLGNQEEVRARIEGVQNQTKK